MSLIMIITIAIFIICILICFYRLIIGPTDIDRYVSVGIMTLLCVSFLGLFALIYESDFLIDLTLDAAILTFIGSLAVAKYLAGKELDE